MDYVFEILDKRDKYFYCTLGEFFSSPEVRKDLPYLKDDYERRWLVLFKDKSKEEVIAVCSYKLQKNGIAKLMSEYVYPDYRRKGLYSFLFQKRMEMARKEGAVRVQSVSNSKIIIDFLKKKGFKIIRDRINYKTLEYEL